MIKLDTLFERKYGAIRGGQTKLAKDLGVDQSSISSWISGRNKPTKDYVKKMATIFGVSEADIYSIFTKEETRTQDEFTQNVQAVPLTKTNTIQLPILADVPAGLPEFSDRDVEMFVDIPRFMFPQADYVVRCIGDSLEPKIHKGDFCVIRNMNEAIDGRAMLVRTENGSCMKVIKKLKGVPQLCSLNPKYKPFTPKSLEILGLIIGHWSRDDKEQW